MSGRIVQFGTSRFLQAHIALFAHEAREAGQQVGPITVVQVSNSKDRAARIAAFGSPEGYPVLLRGIEAGVPCEKLVMVRSVGKALSAREDWDTLKSLFAGDAAFVVSNTADRGYELAEDDRGKPLASNAAPRSFPAKLAALLHHRWKAGAEPITVLPCELVTRNGRELKAAVLAAAREADADLAFLDHLTGEIVFADTLVDRIVSEPIEPVGAIAEPYGLWAIERQARLVLPFEHPSLVLTDDLEPYERLKLHILNLGHTVLADRWLRERRPETQTVREMLEEEAVREALTALYREEIVPGFAARGLGLPAERYAAVTMERFANPFLDHRVADIAQNHAAKIERRAGAFLDWIEGAAGVHATPRLAALVAGGAPESAR